MAETTNLGISLPSKYADSRNMQKVKEALETLDGMFTAGSGITITYDDATHKVTLAADPEFIRDTVAAFIVAGANTTVTHDDGANTLTIAGT